MFVALQRPRDPVDIHAAAPLLATENTHDDREEHAQQRSALVLADAREVADRIGDARKPAFAEN